jgi:hypothetical protein
LELVGFGNKSNGFAVISDVQSLQAPKKSKLKWDCGILYNCKLCERQFFELTDFKKHISTSHDTDMNTFTNEHGDPLLVTNYHECLVCGRGVLHCPSSIRTHLSNAHRLTPSNYFEKHKSEIEEDEIDLPITDKLLLSSIVSKANQSKKKKIHSNTKLPKL